MKTLQQWFNELSEDTQTKVKVECCKWLNPDTLQYAVPLETEVMKKCKTLAELNRVLGEVYKNSNNSSWQEIKKGYLGSVLINKWISIHHPEILSATDCNWYIADVVRNSENCALDLIFLIENNRPLQIELWKRKKCRYDSQLNIWDWLFTVEDFTNLEKQIPDDIIIPNNELTNPIVEIIGIDKAKQLGKENFRWVTSGIHYGTQSDLFDELFFGDDGWSRETKYRVLSNMYTGSRVDLSVFKDFISRIVAVDKTYLRFIKDIVANYPALGTHIYNEKKPAEELTGNETVALTYRYNKEIRNLARLANCCARKSISMVNQASMKEVGPLVKLYGYNFNDIYDAMYPEC